MIYILGTNLDVTDLPLHSELNYSILNEPRKITSTLSMGIRKDDVVKCYIRSDIEISRLAPNCENKLVKFDNDEMLLNLLKGSSDIAKEATPPPENEISTEPEGTTITDEDVEEAQAMIDKDDSDEGRTPETVAASLEEQKTKASVDASDIEELENVTMPVLEMSSESMFEIDLLKSRLISAEKSQKQARETAARVTQERDELYDYATAELEKTVEEYEAKLKDAEQACENLKAELLKAQNIEDSPLSQYSAYAEKCRAVIKAGLTMQDAPTNVITVSAASPDATLALCQSLALLAISGYSGTILDFTGDMAFGIALSNLAFKIKVMQLASQGKQATQQDYAACQADPSKDLVNYIRHKAELTACLNTNYGNSKVGCCGYYHDIALLTFDWEGLLNTCKAQEVSNGQPVIIVLPSMATFVGRYLMSYLSTSTKAATITTCAPTALCCAQNNLNSLPANRAKLLVLNYIKHPNSDQLLTGVLNTKFPIKMFKANQFFTIPEPTKADFDEAIANNSKIWSAAFS